MSWSKRKSIPIDNSAGGALTDHVVRITVTYDSDMDPIFKDLRFVDSDDITVLSHWLDPIRMVKSTSCVCEVKIPSIAAGATRTIYLHYGNPMAESSSSGADTFPFFDDFSSDLDSWTTSGGTWTTHAWDNTLKDWARYSGNPTSTAKGGYVCSVWKHSDGNYYRFYRGASGNDDIFVERSADGLTSWTTMNNGTAIVPRGGASAFDESLCHSPQVWVEGSTWHIYYTGRPASGNDKMGHATASDPPASATSTWTWTKDGGNPIHEDAARDVECVGIIKDGSTYHIWHNNQTSSGDGSLRQVRHATASDPAGPYSEDAGNPIWIGGRHTSSIFKRGSYYYAVVARYRTPSTLNSEIELYRCADLGFAEADREMIGVAIRNGPSGAWDERTLDGPWVLCTDAARDSFPDGELRMYYGAHDSSNVRRIGVTREWDVNGALGVASPQPKAAKVTGDAIQAVQVTSANQTADVEIRAYITMTVGDQAGRHGVCVRYQDASNFYMASILDNGTSSQFELLERASGSFLADIDTYSSGADIYTASHWHDCMLRCVGTALSGEVLDLNDVDRTVSGSDGTLTGAKPVALRAFPESADDEEVYFQLVRVKAAVANEPSVGTFGSEEQVIWQAGATDASILNFPTLLEGI